MEETTKKTLFNALAWMESMKNHPHIDTENIEVGIQCLTEAFGVNVHDVEQKEKYGLNGSSSFEDVFHAGVAALGLETKAPASSIDQDPVVMKNPDLWKKWVAKLEDKGFFNGATAGSDEYNNRLKKALGKFKEKFGDVKPSDGMSKVEKEAKAEEMKAKGNAALNSGDYKKASEFYQQALALSSDGPNSHIYHSNLAAALMYLQKYNDVIDHCEQSIALKPSYVKAYSRMGQAQLHLRDFEGAIDAFRRGLEVDGSNAACKDGLAEAERKVRQSQAPTARPSAGAGAGAGATPGGMPDLSNLASMFGGAGGAGGLADLMNNPALQQMASSMMQNPAMMQMAQNMMQNPDMLNNMMGSLGGMGGGAPGGAPGGAGGMPDMSRMAENFRNNPELQAARSDPELQDFFRDVDSEGPSAAMRHMSNPKVSELMQKIMASMP